MQFIHKRALSSVACCIMLSACGGLDVGTGGFLSGVPEANSAPATKSFTSTVNSSSTAPSPEPDPTPDPAPTPTPITPVKNLMLGDGSITIAAAGLNVGTPGLIPDTLTEGLSNTATPLVSTGNALLTPVARIAAPVTDGLPVNAYLLNTPIGGGNPLAGVNVLSDTSASGSLANVNLVNNGKTAAVSVIPDVMKPDVLDAVSALRSNPLGAVNGATSGVTTALAGTPAGPLVAPASGLLTGATGSAGGITSGITDGLTNSPVSSLLAKGGPAGAVTGAAGAITGTVQGAGSMPGGATGSPVSLNTGDTMLLTGSNPALGLGALSKTPNDGSVLTAGVASAGQPLTVKIGNTSLLPVK